MNYENAWLNYQPKAKRPKGLELSTYWTNSKEAVVQTAVTELKTAVQKLYNIELREAVSGAAAGIQIQLDKQAGLGEGYVIKAKQGKLYLTGSAPNGILYGVFALIRQMQLENDLTGIALKEVPPNPLRMLNHWDNFDGSIERGYSGQSFFFQDNQVIVDERTKAYARLSASAGINSVVINNVNVHEAETRLLEKEHRFQVKRLAEVFKAYGITLYLSLNFAAPISSGGLDSADPLNEQVRGWWRDKMAEVFAEIPDLGGFLVKADSEGRPGPFTYHRTHCDGANMLAKAVKPYGGKIIWRCFVYNCTQDWRDRKTDRARSGYDNFAHLDGQFMENVILQIKNGPMDFQVREPVSPLFGAMEKTNQILEVQIAQEYTGQQKHVCYLIPMFKEVLDFHTHCSRTDDSVADIVSGKTFGWHNCGMAAVANTGSDSNWTGHDLAAANWYGFGRLSFNPGLSAEEIAREWSGCTFGTNPQVVDTITKILMMSWPAYEKYTAPLGIGWMVNPNHHYGPNVDGYEYDRWGTYHRADCRGIGVDRTMTGTGYAGQYQGPNAAAFGSIETCPEELLLFFHYVPYTYQLKTGKTLIQHIYDSHFEGAEEAEEIMTLWMELAAELEPPVYERVLLRMKNQAEHAKEWRDQINTYFYRKSGIADLKKRSFY